MEGVVSFNVSLCYIMNLQCNTKGCDSSRCNLKGFAMQLLLFKPDPYIIHNGGIIARLD
jgi:hypothetical protein